MEGRLGTPPPLLTLHSFSVWPSRVEVLYMAIKRCFNDIFNHGASVSDEILNSDQGGIM